MHFTTWPGAEYLLAVSHTGPFPGGHRPTIAIKSKLTTLQIACSACGSHGGGATAQWLDGMRAATPIYNSYLHWRLITGRLLSVCRVLFRTRYLNATGGGWASLIDLAYYYTRCIPKPLSHVGSCFLGMGLPVRTHPMHLIACNIPTPLTQAQTQTLQRNYFPDQLSSSNCTIAHQFTSLPSPKFNN
ncbi:hypothetical protein ACRALDRAFT_2022763 [Sodiomyces alcalophilus JCM 7366]|uniref:uncharacterized protein n=1 Tax=Sodiomyces alcalophilus JCM 7366 TaxID=591952 RepID=UPI0039B457BA